MADQQTTDPPPPQRGRARAPAPGNHGWKVTPAPDGRGAQQRPDQPPRRNRSRWWIVGIVVALLALNVLLAHESLSPNAPIRVPYSPTFTAQLESGNVREVNSKGDAITGEFIKAIRYPADDDKVKPTTNFETQIPSFADNRKLDGLLQQDNSLGKPVVTDASNPESRCLGAGCSCSSASARRWCSCC